MLKKFMRNHFNRQDEKLRTDFLSESMEIVEKEPSPLGYTIVIVISLLVVTFVAWAFICKTEEIAIARGSITTATKSENIYSPKDGKVKTKYSYEGEKVSVGQKIVEIDYDIEKIDLDYSKKMLTNLKYELMLLEKVISDIDNPNIILDVASETVDEKSTMLNMLNMHTTYLKKIESILLQQNTFKYTDKEGFLKSEQLKSEINVYNTLKANYAELSVLSPIDFEISALEEQITFIEKEYSSFNELFINGAISQAQLQEKQKELCEIKNSLKILQAQKKSEGIQNEIKDDEIDNLISKLQMELQSHEINYDLDKIKLESVIKSVEIERSAFLASMSERKESADNEVIRLELDIELKSKDIENSIIKSPINGIVENLSIGDTGSSVLSNAIIATVVPSDPNLIAEVLVLNKDIGYIKVGQKVSMKLDSFSFQENGTIDGEVSYISPDSISDEALGLVYSVKVTFVRDDLNDVYREGVSNGMQCTAEIVIKERRIINFFFDSITDHFDTSLKVR